MNFLFIIPSRAGSKAIPDKNKKLLNGKPLIAYSIECALTVSNPIDKTKQHVLKHQKH